MNEITSKLRQLAAVTGITIGSYAIAPANALTFNFVSTGDSAIQAALNGDTTVAQDKINAANGFRSAGALWSNYLADNITIKIDIGFTDLGVGTLAQAGSYTSNYSYTQVYNALNTRRDSTDDFAAFNNLSTTASFSRLVNHTSEDNTGNISVAAANSIFMNTANAKALGLLGANATNTDAIISFNSVGYSWDFSHNTNITAGKFDFVGVAAHEIGHALGFVSGVNAYDRNPGTLSQNAANTTSTLDLFRYSSRSNINGNTKVIDLAADTEDKYFSLDGGITKIASFSRGVNFGGDGRQASHWIDNQGAGVMDPTSAPGEYLQISETDLRALDVIGYKRKNTPVPEPSTWIGTIIFGAFGIKTILKRRRKLDHSVDRHQH